MADSSRIEWTDATWNPTAGCDVVSPGCTNCYAQRLAARLERMGQPLYSGLTEATKGGAVWTGRINLAGDEALCKPLTWRRPRRVFVNSMSDLFHDGIASDDIARIFGVMACTQQHVFQVLTKRPKRMADLLYNARFWHEVWSYAADYAHLVTAEDEYAAAAQQHLPLPNVWLGVSVEDQRRADERIPHLRTTPAALRFLSCEPLLGPLDYLYLGEIDWVICGGESGPGARDMDPAWARYLLDQCREGCVPFFMKQMARRAAIPPDLMVREYPVLSMNSGGPL